MVRESLNIAVIGQSTFAAEVYQLLLKNGHNVVAVFTVPDKDTREDPLALTAKVNNTPVFKIKSWQKGGVALPEVFEQYRSIQVDLNVLPFCVQFIPMDVINYPKHKSICYHPSLLPVHRGISAISWTLIHGDKEAGFSIFWPDDGLDTGPVLLQKSCKVSPNDTLDKLYKDFLYPEGILGMVEAVNMVADGTAPKIVQDESRATYEPSLKKADTQFINWNQKAVDIHNFIRGLDSSPGAKGKLNNTEIRLFSSSLWRRRVPKGKEVLIDGLEYPAIQHSKGLLLRGTDGKYVNVERISVEGRMIQAAKYGADNNNVEVIELSPVEKQMENIVRNIWQDILKIEVNDNTDFFKCGGRSMDVVRLVEEVRQKVKLELENQDVFMGRTLQEFMIQLIKKSRNTNGSKKVHYKGVTVEANDMVIRFPNQLFINGEFVDSENGGVFKCINPADESMICEIQSSTKADVDRAVEAATAAFEEGEWANMSARERGRLLHRLADLMEEHKEELATLESLDSGAVYTLALKTHVGMSIETWRYFAGWADKIHGSTIPITNSRPNRNLTFTKKEPIGVCALITPWNYPLMMLSWKMAACLAAGNTVVHKPAEVTSLTALKMAELSVLAGIPPGVINILPGSGRIVGTAMTAHPLVRKVGFTGSTPVGHTIMRDAAVSNLKKVSLELGGKSPLIIFSDADMTRAVQLAIQGAFFNKGENCIAAGRIFVDETIHDEFIEKVVTEIKKLKIGDPLDRSTNQGPQNHLAHLNKLIEYCQIGVKEGARIVYGGKRLDCLGYYFQPAVFTDVTDEMYIAKEEAFGPVMVISTFDESDVDDVIYRANSTEYALAAGIVTKDISRALYLTDKIEAGTVFVNTYNKTDVAAPFGGFKRSGFGKDLGREAIDEYLKTKCVTMEY